MIILILLIFWGFWYMDYRLDEIRRLIKEQGKKQFKQVTNPLEEEKYEKP